MTFLVTADDSRIEAFCGIERLRDWAGSEGHVGQRVLLVAWLGCAIGLLAMSNACTSVLGRLEEKEVCLSAGGALRMARACDIILLAASSLNLSVSGAMSGLQDAAAWWSTRGGEERVRPSAEAAPCAARYWDASVSSAAPAFSGPPGGSVGSAVCDEGRCARPFGVSHVRRDLCLLAASV